MVLLQSSRYEELKKIGTDIIIDAGITDYPFDVFKVARDLDIEVISYQSLSDKKKEICFQESEDGFSLLAVIKGKSQWQVYYNSEMNDERIRFTIMHEISHISADHKDGNEVEESEANFIASFVLAPPCIMHRKKVEDYVDLANEFNVSFTMAHYHIDSYNNWLRYGSRDYTDYEEKIISIYRPKGDAYATT